MIKKELKEFFASVGEGAPDPSILPCGLSGFLREETEAPDSISAQQRKRRFMQSFSLKTEALISESMRGFDGRALCLRGLCGHCILLVNGKKVGEWSSPPAAVYAALPADQEAFAVEIRFPEREVPMDVGLFGGAELIGFSSDLITDVYTEQVHKNEK